MTTDLMPRLVRAPHTDKPCQGGGHFTLGYYATDAGTADRTTVYLRPNRECKLYDKETA